MSSKINTWSSKGKLLITGEYLVMEGALSLALPLQKGQSLSVTENNNNILRWRAAKTDEPWFTAEFVLPSLEIVYTDDKELATKLKEILIAAKSMSHNFLAGEYGFDVVTLLDFNPEYGFGTSSTLISNISRWADIDPYLLLQKTFGGSGYDIACATSNNPILYQNVKNDIRVTNVNFNPPEKENLYFVYLGNKQSSSDSIQAFRKTGNFTPQDIDSISRITEELIRTVDFAEFERLLTEHEKIMSGILKLPTVKSLYFSDYQGAVKSLGAWGGDFILVTGHEPEEYVRSYMKNKGFYTVFLYKKLVE